MAVAGLRGTGSFGTDERPKDFREMILMREPNGDAPLFALTSKSRKRTVTDPEYAWWDEPMDIIRLVGSGTYTSSDTVITVVGNDPNAANPERVYGAADHLKEGDLLLIQPVTDTNAYAAEMVEVVAVISSTQFVVKRGAAGTTAASIADAQGFLLIGSVYSEGTSAPSAVSRNPIKYSNYTQIFKDSYELTGTLDATKTRTGDPWSNDKKRKMFDHARGIELSMLLGKKSEVTGPNGKPKRTMSGIRAQLPTANQKIYSVALTVNTLLDDVYTVFNYSSPAGDERIAFTGNGALNTINKMIRSDANTDIQWGGVTKVYGMNFREFVMPQGRLLLRTHPLLSRDPIYTNSMYILDFSAITYVTLAGRDTKVKDDVQLKDEDARRGFVQTECSVQLDRGGVTCKYLGNIS